MNINNTRILLFFILPVIALLTYPPGSLINGVLLVAVVVAFILLLGFFLWRGSQQLLTLAIFIQGLNVIIRSMMLFSRARPAGGETDWPFVITSLISIALSIYIVFALDRPEVRGQMA